jgi:hypothetical protein
MHQSTTFDNCSLLVSRRLTVELEQGLERRARLYADRLDRLLAAQGDTDPYDVIDDDDLAQILMLLAETALDHDEHTTGLASDPVTGHLISRELADERARRR